jgi:hypothetical protein
MCPLASTPGGKEPGEAAPSDRSTLSQNSFGPTQRVLLMQQQHAQQHLSNKRQHVCWYSRRAATGSPARSCHRRFVVIATEEEQSQLTSFGLVYCPEPLHSSYEIANGAMKKSVVVWTSVILYHIYLFYPSPSQCIFFFINFAT